MRDFEEENLPEESFLKVWLTLLVNVGEVVIFIFLSSSKAREQELFIYHKENSSSFIRVNESD